MGNWGKEVKGGFDRYEATVDGAEFITSEDYQNGEVPLLELHLGNLVTDDGHTQDEWSLSFSVGNGWEIVDNGRGVQYAKDPSRTHSSRSKHGLLVNRIIDEGDLQGALEVLTERGAPNEADVFEGLRFVWERDSFDYGGDIGDVEVVLPVEFVGVDDGSADRSNAASNGDGGADRKKVEAKLKALAKKAADHDEFQDAALEIDEVLNDDDLLDDVVDPDGFYARVA